MKKIRNILSIALVFVMLIGFAPVNVFAGEPSPTVTAPGQPGGTPDPNTPAQTVITEVKIKSDITGDLKAGEEIKNPTLTVEGDNATVTFGKWYKGNAEFTGKYEKDDKYTYTFTVTAKTGFTFGENLKVTLNDEALTVEDIGGAKVYRSKELTAKENTPSTPAPATYTVNVYTNGYGTAKATPDRASKNTTITVKAYPNSGYIVDSIVVRDRDGNKLDLSNFVYKNYYNEYPYWYGRYGYKYSYRYNFYDYRRWCYDTSRTVRSFSNYKYWCRLNDYTVDEDDYDDFIYWYDRYDDDYYYDWRYDRSYTYYDQADFTMPDGYATVEVTFTSAPYWRGGYYYDSRTGTYRRYYDDDDYYYYRYRKNKKSNYYERQAKADEEKDKAEEEKKAPVLKSESRAVITIGSTILNKADMSGQSIMAMDVAAYVKDGRTMLPIRYVAEALGLQVSWVKETRTVLIWDGINRIEIPVDTNKMIVNSVPYINDVKPEMKNGRTMLAVANIARMLGLQDGQDITWDAGKQQVTFVRKIYFK